MNVSVIVDFIRGRALTISFRKALCSSSSIVSVVSVTYFSTPFSFRIPWFFWYTGSRKLLAPCLHATSSPATSSSWTLHDSVSPRCHPSTRQGSFSFTWELGASSSLEFSSRPACQCPRSYDFPQIWGCNQIFRGWWTCRNSWRQVHSCRSWFCHNSFFFLLFLHPLRHLFGAASQAGILSAASGAEMADVEQTKKIVPFVKCEITFGQNVCELMFGVNVPDLNLGIQINSVKQPKQLCGFLTRVSLCDFGLLLSS